MAIINFSIPKTLESRINDAIKTGGYASKAEFFRFAAMNLLDKNNKKSEFPDPELDRLADELGELILEKVDIDNLPSPEEQLRLYHEKYDKK